tara:strand:+ start:72 stop:1076 length:1005 start_codon:yes stop_codon:yes gene_type:complete
MSVSRSEIAKALSNFGLCPLGTMPEMEPLTGGVSSEIWRVTLPDRTVCVKRALAKLKVDADWQAPVERNSFEVAWFEAVAKIFPDAVPDILAHDPSRGFFAMEYFDPNEFVLWKSALMAGHIEPRLAQSVGYALAAIHGATANDPQIAKTFQTDQTFYAIRLEPYLVATAAVVPDLFDILIDLSRRTASIKLALVHGDVSPKNILIGPNGPVFLDAECAWYGDPAFDAAFCLNHFLLKAALRPENVGAYLDCFHAFSDTYLKFANWEPTQALENRIATLLPALFLARVDGKSPVEYLTDENQKNKVRRTARTLLQNQVARLDLVAMAWKEELNR